MKSQANSVSQQVDLAIVGGGLAGCAMAWQATLRGLQVAMIDRCAQETSSRVAAGLVTPITGSRLALSWRYIEFFTQADAFYNAAQRSLDESFWTVAPALRLFSSKDERDLFEARWCVDDPMATGPSIRVDRLTSQDLSGFEAPLGGFLMSPAGRLNTERYLQATHSMLETKGLFFNHGLDLDQDLKWTEDTYDFPSLHLRARSVCLAQGIEARANRWFGSLPLHPARGDILRVLSHGPKIDHVVHYGGWIVPLGADEFLLGATYSRQGQDCQIDGPIGDAAQDELVRRWQAFFAQPVPALRVITHRAAVRPASYDRHPLVGVHREFPRLMCLNGLGSKGSLMAPGLAALLLDCIEHDLPIEKALRYDRKEL